MNDLPPALEETLRWDKSVYTFKAKRRQLLLEVVAVIGVGVLLVIWKRAAISWFLVTFLLAYLAYRLFLSGETIKTVRLSPDGVDVVPLLPWFKPRKWQMDEIAAYRSVAFRGNVHGKPFMGILTPKEGKPETIWASGTDRFFILDEFLSKLLPTPND
jgi:hypothetical protein